MPLAAEIFIAGYDRDSSQVYSDTLTGDFVRFLAPGSWNLTFSSEGYRDTTINNVMVYSGQRTDLNVEMTPEKAEEDTTRIIIPKLYPDPATTEIKMLLPERFSGMVRISIYDMAGRLMKEYNAEYSPGIPIITDISFLPSGTYNIVITHRHIQGAVRGRFIVVK